MELLPHVTRLVPAADKFLAGRSASEKAQQEALAALADNVRAQLSGVNDEQAGLRRQLQEQSDQVAQVGVEVTRARIAIETVETRIAKLEQASQTAFRLLVSALVVLMGIAILAVVILIKQPGH